MNPPDKELSEQERIRSVYRDWHGGKELSPYAWHRPEVMEQDAARNRVGGRMLAAMVGHDLAPLHIVDVGCGSGGFLRQLISWGARPANLAGTEYQDDRLAQARAATAAGVRWHLGDLDAFAASSLDLAVANTVFSSILDEQMRLALAAAMWRVVKPGGWCMVFDFRYNSPSNPHVRKVARAELRAWWPGAVRHEYQTLLLAPPIARRLSSAPRLASDLLATFVPPLRSHFIYMARKD
ncbi:MAG: class I SAM-dependent methyltransferase [Telluria sp.]